MHYFCRFQDGSWHLGVSMTAPEWFEFEWSGTGNVIDTGMTADAYVAQCMNLPAVADVQDTTGRCTDPTAGSDRALVLGS